jgi:acid stress chaperone HdeB
MFRAVGFFSLLLFVSSPASAQVTLDLTRVDCNQFATFKVASPDKIAIWLNGYFHGARGDLSIDTQQLDSDADQLTQYCVKNPGVPLMDAVHTLFGARK